MGQGARRKQQFLIKHPICIFCGGAASAVTIEHCPPRAMFRKKHWPEGFEFPSCERCNQGSSNQDLLIAFFVHASSKLEGGINDSPVPGLILMVKKQYLNLFKKMLPSSSEARGYNRALGVTPPIGNTHQSAGVLKVTTELQDAIYVFAKKLSKAIFYKQTNNIFVDTGGLLLHWFSNATVIRDGGYAAFDSQKELAGKAPVIERCNRYLNDQFTYKISTSIEKDVFVLQAKFGEAFGFVVFGSTITGLIESADLRLRKALSKNELFTIIQSPAISITPP